MVTFEAGEIDHLGFVYFMVIRQLGIAKVGHTKGVPERRRKAVQTGIEPEVELYATIRVVAPATCERQLHRYLSARRVRLEWFSITPQEIDAILPKIRERVASRKYHFPEARHFLQYQPRERKGSVCNFCGMPAGTRAEYTPVARKRKGRE
jgi:hypothetical protein